MSRGLGDVYKRQALWAWYGRNTPRQHPSVSEEELVEIGNQPQVHSSISARQLLRLCANRNVLLLFISYMCMNYTFYLLSNWVFLYLVQERNFSVLDSGVLAIAPPLAAAVGAGVGGLVTGILTQRCGNRWGYRIVPLVAMPAAAALLLFAPAANAALLRPDASDTLVTAPNYEALCAAVRRQAAPHALVIFWNPRVLALSTGRFASGWPAEGQPGRMVRYLRRVRPDYIVADKSRPDDRRFLIPVLTAGPLRLATVYENDQFTLMRLLEAPNGKGPE